MKRTRMYYCNPINSNTLTEKQIDVIRRQENAEELLMIYKEIEYGVIQGNKVTPSFLSIKTGLKKVRIRRLLRKIDTLIY